MRYGAAGMKPSGCNTTCLGPSAPMCSQTVADPGPPLKAKVSGRLAGILPVERVGHEKHFGFDLPVAALDGKPPRSSGVLQRFAIDRDLVMGHDRRHFRHVVVLFLVLLGSWLGSNCLLLFRSRIRFGGFLGRLFLRVLACSVLLAFFSFD